MERPVAKQYAASLPSSPSESPGQGAAGDPRVHEIKLSSNKNKFAFSRAARQTNKLERPIWNERVQYDL